jgi:hypothetical protein
MSIAAQKVLSDAKALSPDEMRVLLRDISEVLEDLEDLLLQVMQLVKVVVLIQ